MIKDVVSESDVAYFVITGDVCRSTILKEAKRKHCRAVYRKADSSHWFEILKYQVPSDCDLPESYYYDIPYYGIIPPDAWIAQY